MKLFFLIISFSFFTLAQAPLEKIEPLLKSKLTEISNDEEVLVWINFTDKGSGLNKYTANPASVVSDKSLKRRSKVLPEGELIHFEDLPVNSNYIDGLAGKGFKVKQKSKWLNAVSGYANKSLLERIEALPFVKSIDIVYKLRKPEPAKDESSSFNKISQPEGIYSFNYGQSFTQVQQINVPAVHNLGYTGSSVTICVLDAGFNRLTHESFSTINIIAAWDFVNGDPDVTNGAGSGTHGTQTLSTIGGFKEGSLIGPAFGAAYILAKTENTESETPIEEDNWIAAVEWADSIGVDVTSTSLGYIDFDPPFTSYTWQSMDGNTCRITIAADLAVKKGIVVLNSAGNSGFHSTRNTLGAPSDGDSVIAVGAVTSTGNRSSFSSVGPTVDGRIKPDIMAMGSSVRVASPSSNTGYTYSSGTSFSCPLAAGVAALVLDVNPNLTPMQVRDALRNTASRSNNPDREYGWGILDALAAIEFFPVPVELISFAGKIFENKIQLAWTTGTETNNLGFEIEKKINNKFTTLGFAEGNGNSTELINYSFVDINPSAGKNIYRLKQLDYDGSFEYSKTVEVDFFVKDFSLSQNYPNPFNPLTNIEYRTSNFGFVTLKIFDLLGNEIATLVNEAQEPGKYEVEWNAEGFASGVYIYQISAIGEAREFTASKKLLLMK